MDIYTKTRIKTNIVTALFVVILGAAGVWGYMMWRRDSAPEPRDTRDADIEMPRYVPRPAAPQPFTDGLGRANASTQYELDEFGAGVASRGVFNRDINGDGKSDRITRTRVENGTSHFYEDYKIELNIDDRMVDITPPDLRTIEGAECALQKIKFVFRPDFRIIKIARPWQDTWATPTPATKTVYSIVKDQIGIASQTPMPTVCDVAELFE